MLPLRNITKSFFTQTRTMTTIASLKRLSAKSLSEKILQEVDATDPTFAVIDVRDNGKYNTKPCFRNDISDLGSLLVSVLMSKRLHRWPHQGLNKCPRTHSRLHDANSSASPQRQKDSRLSLCAEPTTWPKCCTQVPARERWSVVLHG